MMQLSATLIALGYSSGPEATPEVTTVATSNMHAYADGFSFPWMGGTRTVFSGVAASGSNLALVASNQAGHLHTIATTSTTTVTTKGARTFEQLSDVSASATSTAYVGVTKASVGIYVAQGADVTTAVVETGTASGFSSVSNPTLDMTGKHLAFQGTLHGKAGIFAAAAGGEVTTLVETSQPVPGGGGATLQCLDNPAVGADGTVAFFGSSCNGAPLMAGKTRMRRTVRASQHALHDSASNLHAGIFLASMGGDAASTLRVAADLRTAVPGGEKGETFTAFSDPVAGDATVAFVASTSAGRLGVYVFELASATLRLVANTATAVPGEGAGAFGDFPYPPAVSGNTTVFYGAAGGAQSGIYAHRRTARGDELAAVITQADSLNGGEPISFLGSAARATDGSSVAFYGVTSSADGVYSAKLPFKG